MKLQISIFVGLLACFVSADVCTDDTGYWVAAIAEGVVDYYAGGARLNQKYYCFEGCLNTGTALQNYKISLGGNVTTQLRERSKKAVLHQLQNADDDDQDPNAEFCIDPVLRADVAKALKKNTQSNCKGIINTLVLNLNRSGWAMTCISFDEFSLDGVVQDVNFCSYDHPSKNDLYTIRLAKLDMS